MAREYQVISTDDHIIEPEGMFDGRLPKEFSDRTPKLVEAEESRDAAGRGQASSGSSAAEGRQGFPNESTSSGLNGTSVVSRDLKLMPSAEPALSPAHTCSRPIRFHLRGTFSPSVLIPSSRIILAWWTTRGTIPCCKPNCSNWATPARKSNSSRPNSLSTALPQPLKLPPHRQPRPHLELPEPTQPPPLPRRPLERKRPPCRSTKNLSKTIR